MSNTFLGNILFTLTGSPFGIYGPVNNETDYDSNVVFEDPSQKPSWAAVQGSRDNEEWKSVRGQRNKKLNASDWTQLSDVPLSDAKREGWQVYRQALRDVPSQSDPLNVTWPSAPA